MPKKKSTPPKNSIPIESLVQAVKAAAEADSKDAPTAQLSKLNIKSPLILIGPQTLRSKRMITWLRKKIFEPVNTEVVSYFGAELTNKQTVANLVGELSALSLFAKNQLLVIYQADKVKAAYAKEIAPAITSAASSTFVVLAAEKSNLQTPLVKQLLTAGTVVAVDELSGNGLLRWIKKEARNAGAAAGIAPDAAQLLAQCYGTNLDSIANEISKLALLCGENPIDKKLVETVSLKTPEQNSFELFNQLAKKNLPRSLRLASDLHQQGMHPLQINAFLSRCLRTVLASKASGGHVQGNLGNPWFVKKLSAAGRSYTEDELERGINTLCEFDMKLKGSKLNDTELLAGTVVKLARRAA